MSVRSAFALPAGLLAAVLAWAAPAPAQCVTPPGEAAAAAAEATVVVPAPLRLDEPAPDFEARSTHGPVRLADYRGRWLVLFSHPSDFTPVCTTEFVGFARASERFRALDTELLGLSTDGLFSHIAWTRAIREKLGVEIPFPIVEDTSMRVARAYGMIHPGASDTAAVRGLFVIDPQGVLRAMMYYPMSTGRSVDEVLRLVEALQTSDREGLAMPEGWRPGEPGLVPPPTTTAAADVRPGEGLDCVDWFLCRKPLGDAPLASAHRAIVTERLEPFQCGTITRLHTFAGIFLASQPSPEDLEQAVKGGVKTVVNLRHESEVTDFDEPALVARLGLAYVSLPWNGADELTDEVFDRARRVLGEAERPMLVHCSSANRVGAVWIPWRVLDGGVDVATALAEARTIGLKTPAYEQLALDYVARQRGGGSH